MAEPDWFMNAINNWIFLFCAYWIYIIGWFMYIIGSPDWALDTLTGLELTPPGVTSHTVSFN